MPVNDQQAVPEDAQPRGPVVPRPVERQIGEGVAGAYVITAERLDARRGESGPRIASGAFDSDAATTTTAQSN